MDLQKVLSNNQEWVKGKLSQDPDYFENLAQGQSPEILYIGCSDSRVTAEELMGLGPGDVFVTRNIANMVHNLDQSVASVINYAVMHLKVNHVVVCGHYYCGGVKAAMGNADLTTLNPWLRAIKDVYRLHKEELDGIADENDRYNRLVELNVREQCINAVKTTDVQSAIEERGLQVHGWVFDIGTGKLIDLDFDAKEAMADIRDVYHFG